VLFDQYSGGFFMHHFMGFGFQHGGGLILFLLVVALVAIAAGRK